MKKHLIHFLLVAVLSICSAAAFAQTTVKGQLVDSETGEPLVGAAVMVEGTSQGTVTDMVILSKVLLKVEHWCSSM